MFGIVECVGVRRALHNFFQPLWAQIDLINGVSCKVPVFIFMRRNIHGGKGSIIRHQRMCLQGVECEARLAMPSVLATIGNAVGDSFTEIRAQLTPRSICSVRAVRSGMLRWACCFATENGIEVCTPVQDALLIGGPADEIEDVVAATPGAMAQAYGLVLDVFRLRAKPVIVKLPERYSDERGEAMWNRAIRLLGETEARGDDDRMLSARGTAA